MKATKKGFTLVELLVVIGIIAVLIGVLLPALNKARQQANLISCQANMHSIGQVLAIYESAYKGFIPLAQIDNPDQFTQVKYPGLKEPRWYWMFALGEMLNKKMLADDGYVRNLPKTFADVDVVDAPATSSSGVPYFWISHYMANPVVFRAPQIYFYGTNDAPQDAVHNPSNINRRIGDIKYPSNVFAVWDGPQSTERNLTTYPVALQLDQYALYDFRSGLTYGHSALGVDIDLPVFPALYPNSGNGRGRGNGAAYQKQDNFDGDVDFDGVAGVVSFRFRHMKNTTLAALCCDGHVETRLVGTVVRRDVYTNNNGTGQ